MSANVCRLTATGANDGTPTFTGTSCTNSAALAGSIGMPLSSGGLAWGTTIHATPVIAAPYSVSELPFRFGTLSREELASVTNRCANIIGNGSSYGICRSCRAGGLNAARL